jgi:hypothetical protein
MGDFARLVRRERSWLGCTGRRIFSICMEGWLLSAFCSASVLVRGLQGHAFLGLLGHAFLGLLGPDCYFCLPVLVWLFVALCSCLGLMTEREPGQHHLILSHQGLL